MKDYLPILDEQKTKEFKKYVVDNMRKWMSHEEFRGFCECVWIILNFLLINKEEYEWDEKAN